MNYLLDTHYALWLVKDPANLLTAQELNTIRDNKCYIGFASLWEFTIKKARKKQFAIEFPFTVEHFFNSLETEGIGLVNQNLKHLQWLSSFVPLPGHKDPFDHMLMAIAETEGLTMLTIDRDILQYQNLT